MNIKQIILFFTIIILILGGIVVIFFVMEDNESEVIVPDQVNSISAEVESLEELKDDHLDEAFSDLELIDFSLSE